MVNRGDDHKLLDLRFRFLRYSFASILLAIRMGWAIRCGKTNSDQHAKRLADISESVNVRDRTQNFHLWPQDRKTESEVNHVGYTSPFFNVCSVQTGESCLASIMTVWSLFGEAILTAGGGEVCGPFWVQRILR